MALVETTQLKIHHAGNNASSTTFQQFASVNEQLFSLCLRKYFGKMSYCKIYIALMLKITH